MLSTIVTVIVVSAFFILFFGRIGSKNKRKNIKKQREASTTAGFVEDTYRDPVTNRFITPEVGEIGNYTGYSSVPENHWLHGFPHKKTK